MRLSSRWMASEQTTTTPIPLSRLEKVPKRPVTKPYRGSPEAEIVYWLKNSLRDTGIQGRTCREIIVDADGSYLSSPFHQALEPTGTIWIGGWRPDLVCVLEEAHTERIAAFEVKASTDHEKGVVQARRYRAGAHEAYLCVPRTGSRSPDWLREHATESGIGLVRVTARSLELDVEPAPLRPDPAALAITQRYLLGQRTIRALGLNKPLHYVAVLMAMVSSSEPITALATQWGLQASAIQHAVRGAETLGLVVGGQVTIKGHAYAEIFRALGFDLTRTRALTRKRLVEHEPALAAVIRSILLDQPPVELIIRILATTDGPTTIEQLATRAHAIDEGMASALFAARPEPGEPRLIRPSTRFNLKAALYDVGLIDSPLARSASGPQRPGGCDPAADVWQIGAACGTIHVDGT